MLFDVTCVLILSVVLKSCNCDEHKKSRFTDFIRGTYHAWWVIVGVPKVSAEDMLRESEETNDVTLTNHTLVGFPENAHPVLFEIGKEYNCGPIVSSALRSDFLEFKFEIPFVTSSKSKEPLNYKQRLYESTELNSISSKLMYGLNASKAKMNMTDTTYGVLFDNNKFIANFSSDNDPGWINAKDFALIKPYRDIMNLWWFGRQDKNICAQHKYDFDSALIRPSVANLRFDKSLINAFFPGDKYHVNPLSADDLYGAVQININFTMTFPEKC